MNTGELYAGREQTLVKHYVLEQYLERFAHIVGSWSDAITYVDCFSGPWNARDHEGLSDSSFSLALRQLKLAREHLGGLRASARRPPLKLRCFFLEKDATAYRQLEEFAASHAADAEIRTRNAALEDSVAEIRAFVSAARVKSFPFIFLDPTGWRGLEVDVVRPLLQLVPCEVLVNFMTGHILRFVEHPDERQRLNFDRLFGSDEYRRRIESLQGLDREDELVRCYSDAIRAAGAFSHVCTAIVLHKEINRTHFHLLYATRSRRGVEVFKKTERDAWEVMKEARSEAQQRCRQARTGQMEMFSADAMHDPSHYFRLRDRHLAAAKKQVSDMLASRGAVPYDDVWDAVLSHPLVWESDLRGWISDWLKAGQISIDGLGKREKPKVGARHVLRRASQ